MKLQEINLNNSNKVFFVAGTLIGILWILIGVCYISDIKKYNLISSDIKIISKRSQVILSPGLTEYGEVKTYKEEAYYITVELLHISDTVELRIGREDYLKLNSGSFINNGVLEDYIPKY